MALHSAHVLTATVLTTPTIPLSVISGTVGLDDSWTPYVQSEIIVYTPDQAFIDSVDPRLNIRVQLVTTQTFLEDAADRTPVSRTFNLMLRERRIDSGAGTMSLYLESDEASLRDWALVSLTPERIYGVSVKSAVTYALAKIGATLQAGAAGATLPTKTLEPVITNYATNPSAEIDASDWNPAGSCTVAWTTTQSWIGTGSIMATATAAAAIAITRPYVDTVAGTQYTYTQYVRSQTARSIRLDLRFQNASNVTVGADILGTAVTSSTTGWTRYTVTGVAPVGSVKLLCIWRTVSTCAVGEKHYADAAMVTIGTTEVPYFDGATLNGRNAGLYAVAWIAGFNSASTLTNLPNSDAMIWAPGLSAADYCFPLVTAGGLRLICDEQRRWYLVTAITSDAQINVSSETGVISGQDTISRNDDSPWYDSVVVKYEWTDAANLQQVAYDIAGTGGGRTLLEVVPRIYLGTGAAAAILARAQGKGRTFSVSSQSNYSATPGQSVSIALPDATLQTGTLSSVSWSFPDSTMAIGSRGLTDTPAGAWTLAPVGRTWSSQPATTWNTYTN